MARIGSVQACSLLLDVQYSRQSFQNRSRIRNADGWQWLTVPVLGGQFGTGIRDMQIEEAGAWRKRHLKGLRYNYATSPFYDHYLASIKDLLSGDLTNLADLTCKTVTFMAVELGFETRIEISESKSVPSGGFISDATFRYEHPQYRQNFEGFIPMMSSLDVLFNHGPDSKRIIMEGIVI